MIDPRSLSAFMSAFTRAHHALNDQPKVFDDTLARRFFTDAEYAEFTQNLTRALAFFDPEAAKVPHAPPEALALTLRAMGSPITLARARYTEDCLIAVAEHVKQYVILGAGLDSFAYRRPDHLSHVAVFEVDEPVTQREKRRRVKEHDLTAPTDVHFVAHDFTQGKLGPALEAEGYHPTELSFFSWLGVTYYLSRDAVLATLTDLTSLASPGSTLIFDFFDADAFDDAKASPRIKRMRAVTQQSGHPMITGFTVDDLRSETNARKLVLDEVLTPEDIEKRYFAGRTDGLRAMEHVHFARLTVAAR